MISTSVEFSGKNKNKANTVELLLDILHCRNFGFSAAAGRKHTSFYIFVSSWPGSSVDNVPDSGPGRLGFESRNGDSLIVRNIGEPCGRL